MRQICNKLITKKEKSLIKKQISRGIIIKSVETNYVRLFEFRYRSKNWGLVKKIKSSSLYGEISMNQIVKITHESNASIATKHNFFFMTKTNSFVPINNNNNSNSNMVHNGHTNETMKHFRFNVFCKSEIILVKASHTRWGQPFAVQTLIWKFEISY